MDPSNSYGGGSASAAAANWSTILATAIAAVAAARGPVLRGAPWDPFQAWREREWSLAVRSLLFVCVVYARPKLHWYLTKEREQVPPHSDEWWRRLKELSWEELRGMLFEDAKVQMEHHGNDPNVDQPTFKPGLKRYNAGEVYTAWQDPTTGDTYCGIRLMDSYEGRVQCEMLLRGLWRGVSIGHTRIPLDTTDHRRFLHDAVLRVDEVSLCWRGLRPGTGLVDIWHVQYPPNLKWSSDVYNGPHPRNASHVRLLPAALSSRASSTMQQPMQPQQPMYYQQQPPAAPMAGGPPGVGNSNHPMGLTPYPTTPVYNAPLQQAQVPVVQSQASDGVAGGVGGGVGVGGMTPPQQQQQQNAPPGAAFQQQPQQQQQHGSMPPGSAPQQQQQQQQGVKRPAQDDWSQQGGSDPKRGRVDGGSGAPTADAGGVQAMTDVDDEDPLAGAKGEKAMAALQTQLDQGMSGADELVDVLTKQQRRLLKTKAENDKLKREQADARSKLQSMELGADRMQQAFIDSVGTLSQFHGNPIPELAKLLKTGSALDLAQALTPLTSKASAAVTYGVVQMVTPNQGQKINDHRLRELIQYKHYTAGVQTSRPDMGTAMPGGYSPYPASVPAYPPASSSSSYGGVVPYQQQQQQQQQPMSLAPPPQQQQHYQPAFQQPAQPPQQQQQQQQPWGMPLPMAAPSAPVPPVQSQASAPSEGKYSGIHALPNTQSSSSMGTPAGASQAVPLGGANNTTNNRLKDLIHAGAHSSTALKTIQEGRHNIWSRDEPPR